MTKKKAQEKMLVGKAASRKAEVKPLAVAWYKNTMQLGLVVAVLAVTFCSFLPVLSKEKEFINFDDPVYITSNDLITKLDARHLTRMFAQHDASLNYHPLTMLSLAINYAVSKLHPFGYFFINLFIHLLNTLLVFVFLYRLPGKQFWTGLVAAALFGIHPMHVESVAWAAERKDVLYCFFFLASCITYLYYLEAKQTKYLMYCFVLFFLSCLSKAMAVPLPLVLLLIDYFKERKMNAKVFTEKIPFFLLSLVLGYVAVTVQSKGAISSSQLIPLAMRPLYASYGFMMYVVKLFAPVHLSAFYPYPIQGGSSVPIIYKVAPVIVLLIVVVPLVISYKTNKAKFRIWLFGLGFFVLMVALVLQLLSVGAAIMADRYSYLPYIGLFFIIGSYTNELLEKAKTKLIAGSVLAVVIVLLAVTTYARVQVWQNDLILWTNVIDQYPAEVNKEAGVIHYTLPEGISIAYDNRANYYRLHNDLNKAFDDYEVLARYQSANEGIYNNLGNIYCVHAQDTASKGNRAAAHDLYEKALDMYTKALSIKPDNLDAIHNRAITYSSLGDHEKALEDFKHAQALNPNDGSIQSGVAGEEAQLGRYKEAIEDYNKALVMNPGDGSLLFYRGTTYVNAGSYNEGIRDLTACAKINPANAECWYNLSVAYNKINEKQQALDAALNAKKNGYPVTDQYMAELRSGGK